MVDKGFESPQNGLIPPSSTTKSFDHTQWVGYGQASWIKPKKKSKWLIIFIYIGAPNGTTEFFNHPQMGDVIFWIQFQLQQTMKRRNRKGKIETLYDKLGRICSPWMIEFKKSSFKLIIKVFTHINYRRTGNLIGLRCVVVHRFQLDPGKTRSSLNTVNHISP